MKNLLMQSIFCLLLIALCGCRGEISRVGDRQRVPAAPRIHTLTQPDGTTFDALQWGDEWLHGWETTDQYTIIQEQRGYWMYAVLNATGQLVPSVLVVGKDSPEVMGIPKRLRPTKPQR